MRTDAELIQIIDAAVADAASRAGDHLACRRGCTHCCIGPFAVTDADLARLRIGLTLLPEDQQQRIHDRAAEAREAMRAGFPGHWETGRVASQEAADAFDTGHASLPCPILDLETGACSLHEHRPVACRLHGPALRVNGLDLRHCRLNYTGLSDVEIAARRVSVDLGDAPESGLTYIAFL